MYLDQVYFQYSIIHYDDSIKLILLILYLIEFILEPISQVCDSDSEAVFKCSYQSSPVCVNVSINWKINEEFVGLFPDITRSSIIENGTLVYTLTIPAGSEYNRTEVVCLAFFGNKYEETPPVFLTIYAAPLNTTGDVAASGCYSEENAVLNVNVTVPPNGTMSIEEGT